MLIDAVRSVRGYIAVHQKQKEGWRIVMMKNVRDVVVVRFVRKLRTGGHNARDKHLPLAFEAAPPRLPLRMRLLSERSPTQESLPYFTQNGFTGLTAVGVIFG